MAKKMKAVRRVVTGNDAQGKSIVSWDGDAPARHEGAVPGRGVTDYWVWNKTPQPLNGSADASLWPDEFPGPKGGGHLRTVHWLANHDVDGTVPPLVTPHAPVVSADGRSWDRGGGNNVTHSDMHKTESVDFGIVMEGERGLELDDITTVIRPGDIVIQVGAWHLWDSSRIGCLMAFDMISAEFDKQGLGLQEEEIPVMLAKPNQVLPAGVKPQRRIITIDKEPGKSSLVADSFSPDVILDPARPGFALQRMWVIDSHPARIVPETLHLPYVLVPPKTGTVLNVCTFPPDSNWSGKVSKAQVEAFYKSARASEICTSGTIPNHPYSQKSNTIDFCLVMEGEIFLILDTKEIHLRAGEFAVIRGGNHAWSNRSTQSATVAISSHDGVTE
ncbi:hypothetical protein ICN46_10130 [Polynucleobacter sp. Latsch14-2]|jgi:uncharacterized cupin superfamily protein|uniref:hypothetical protein n=1 Tax=Polynucleobacter sp. Latsch14-2 TaxID=2576920 RepID=UPI001C0CED76|nr:hypothetical protein [Polynucleobacter sp. Latsch14-2]MBU3615256.1 hypothetical protein [Polynucleobacter sp. Latsch14-2]